MNVLYTIKMFWYDLDVYGTLEKPLFLAVDVAGLIDYSVGNTAHMLDVIDPEDKILVNVTGTRNSGTSGGPHNVKKWFLTEDGFYEIMMQSRKPNARKFKRAVKNILHDLRMQRQENLGDWLNCEDGLSDEWDNLNRKREKTGLDEITWNDFLRSKGWTDDMLSDN